MENVANKTGAATLSFGKLTAAFAAGQAIFYAAESALREVGTVVGSTINAAEKYQDAEIGLQNAINNNTTLRDKSIATLNKQADALSNVTAFSEQQYVAADNLLAIHKLSQAQIEALVPHIADMAQGMADATGEMPNLGSATQLVAKALGENDASGLSASLKRAGIALTKHQQDVLKTGDMTEKLGVITDLLAGHFKGASTNTAQASIQLAIMHNEIEKAQEKIGQAFLPAIDQLTTKFAHFVSSDQFQNWLNKVVTIIQRDLPPVLQWLYRTGLPALFDAFKAVGDILKVVVPIVKDVLTFIWDHKDVILPLTLGILAGVKAFEALTAIMKMNQAIQYLMGFVQTVVAQFGVIGAAKLALDAVVSTPMVLAIGIGAAIAAITYVMMKINEMQGALDNFKRSLDVAKGTADELNKSLDKVNDPRRKAELQAYLNSPMPTVQKATGIDTIGDVIYRIFTHKAAGGSVFGGSPYVVGENGPELFVPARSGSIVPNNQMSAGGGGGVTLNVNMGMYAGEPGELRQAAKRIYQELMRIDRANGTNALPAIGVYPK